MVPSLYSSSLEDGAQSAVSVLFSDTRIVIYKYLDHSTSVFLDYDCDTLRFCGLGDEKRVPVYGITIEGVDPTWREMNRSSEVLRLLNVEYIVNELFGFDSVKELKAEKPGEKRERTRSNKTKIELPVHYLDFESIVMDLVFLLSNALEAMKSDSIVYFIGEYKERSEDRGHKCYKGSCVDGVIVSQPPFSSHLSVRMKDKRYSGYAVSGKPEGEGTVSYCSSAMYSGFSRGGKMSFGTYGHSLSTEVTSLWGSTGRHGICLESYGDGIVYYGYCKEGMKNGEGVMLTANGSVALGVWERNFINGTALSLSHLPTVYNGQMVRQYFNGYGEMYYRNMSNYKGSWNGGQYHQYGLLSVKCRERPVYSLLAFWNHGARVEARNIEKDDDATIHNEIQNLRRK